MMLALAAGSTMLLGAGLSTADAMPGHVAGIEASPAGITLASGGCGFGGHRGFYGRCRPNLYRGYGYHRFGYHRYGYRRGYYRNF